MITIMMMIIIIIIIDIIIKCNWYYNTYISKWSNKPWWGRASHR